MSIGGYPEIFLAVWSGSLGATDEEIFSYHRMVAADGTMTAPVLAAALANDVTDMLAESTTGSTPFSNLGQVFPTTVSWDLLKVYSFDPAIDEITSDPAMEVLTDVGLGASGQGLPYQDSLAISFTNLPTTRRSKNRFYLPPFVSTATDGHGRVLGTLIDDFQTQLNFSQNAHLAASPSFQFCVYSPTGHTISTLDRWMTGDVMDTIRRRRNKLPESRHVLASP
jgi:hypothetical protein